MVRVAGATLTAQLLWQRSNPTNPLARSTRAPSKLLPCPTTLLLPLMGHYTVPRWRISAKLLQNIFIFESWIFIDPQPKWWMVQLNCAWFGFIGYNWSGGGDKTVSRKRGISAAPQFYPHHRLPIVEQKGTKLKTKKVFIDTVLVSLVTCE